MEEITAFLKGKTLFVNRASFMKWSKVQHGPSVEHEAYIHDRSPYFLI